MATVFEVSLTVKRTRQVREYEPKTAEIVLKAQVAEADDIDAILVDLGYKADAHVNQLLGFKSAEAPVAEVKAEVKQVEPPKKEAAPKEEEKLTKRSRGLKKKAEQADAKKATASQKEKAAPPVEDELADEPAAKKNDAEEWDLGKVQARLGEELAAGNIEMEDLTAALKKFGAAKVSALDPSNFGALIDAVLTGDDDDGPLN